MELIYIRNKQLIYKFSQTKPSVRPSFYFGSEIFILSFYKTEKNQTNFYFYKFLSDFM